MASKTGDLEPSAAWIALPMLIIVDVLILLGLPLLAVLLSAPGQSDGQRELRLLFYFSPLLISLFGWAALIAGAPRTAALFGVASWVPFAVTAVRIALHR